jgi:hypothetical protein
VPRRGGSGAGQPRRFGGFGGVQTRRPGLVVLLGFAAAILLRERRKLYQLPEERPIVD